MRLWRLGGMCRLPMNVVRWHRRAVFMLCASPLLAIALCGVGLLYLSGGNPSIDAMAWVRPAVIVDGGIVRPAADRRAASASDERSRRNGFGSFSVLNQTFYRSQTLSGALLFPTTAARGASGDNWTVPEVIEHNVTLSVLFSFSPHVEDHARLMFEDKFSECRFYAMGPAMAEWRGEVVVCVRLFLSQYLLALSHPKLAPVDTWQENYVYALRLRTDDYEPLEVGHLLGIPTTVNSGYRYRKDGPMDPRAFIFKDRLYLIFYAHGEPIRNSTARCRMYFWNYEQSIKKLISVSGIPLLEVDINWTPLVVGGDVLYLIYTFDPLRVLQCDPDAGSCVLHYAQPGAKQFPFRRSEDALRGGTPFVEYSHPYYVSIAHAAVSLPQNGAKPSYSAHVTVVRVNPWRLVYVSSGIDADPNWLQSWPLVLSDYVATPFWYPTALLPRGDLHGDVYDVGGHVNDHSSYVFRLLGVRKLLADVVARDGEWWRAATRDGNATSMGPRVAQRFVVERSRQKQELLQSSQTTTAKSA